MPSIGEIQQGYKIGYKNNGKYMWLACSQCGKERWVPLRSVKNRIPQNIMCRTCAGKLKGKMMTRRGSEHPSWKGGRIIDGYGYVKVTLPPDDFFYSMTDRKQGYIREHRLVMARHLGRCLHSWEYIHHKNGIKDDNRIENLELQTSSEHLSAHTKGYQDGYNKGLIDGRNKQIAELKQEIKLLQWQVKELFCYSEVKE